MSEHHRGVENKPDSHRRRLLKTLAMAGFVVPVLPERWTRPVVDTVLLPAHAGTSDPPQQCPDGTIPNPDLNGIQQ